MKKYLVFLPLVIPLVLFLPNLGAFPYASTGAPFSDFSLSHYPAYLFLQRSIQETGQIPMWSPGILSGSPTIANPLSGLWYPPGWLALLLPLPEGLNLLTAFHLVFGGVGMFLFLRKRSLTLTAALAGAVAFQLIPKIYAHYGAGHLTLVWALCWTPWLLLAQSAPRRFFRPGIILSLILLCDVRWAVYAGILWGSWILFGQGDFSFAGKVLLHRMESIFKEGILAIGLASPFLVPFLEFVRLSTRTNMVGVDRLYLSLPIERMIGIFFPGLHGMHEWVIYPGAVVIALVSAGMFFPGSRHKARFWIWIALLSLAIALGEALPFSTTISSLPPFSLLRIPPRSLFLTGFSFAVLAAYALDEFVANPSQNLALRIWKAALVLSVILVPFIVVFGLASGIWTGAVTQAGIISVLTLILLGTALRLENKPGRAYLKQAALVLIFLLALYDWGGLSLPGLLQFRGKDRTLGEAAEIAEDLSAVGGLFRIYSPSASLPQQTAAYYQLELADGVDPLQLAPYQEFMAKATGVRTEGYSVTIPPFDGDPAVANRIALPNAEKLGWLNVRYIVSNFPLTSSSLLPLPMVDDRWVYQNQLSRPRAWVQEQVNIDSNFAPVQAIQVTPNRITLTADVPGILVLSEVAYPGWRVMVDGEPAEMLEVENLFRGTTLLAGTHLVEFIFRPVSLYIGAAIFFITAIFLFFCKRVQDGD